MDDETRAAAQPIVDQITAETRAVITEIIAVRATGSVDPGDYLAPIYQFLERVEPQHAVTIIGFLIGEVVDLCAAIAATVNVAGYTGDDITPLDVWQERTLAALENERR